MHIFSNTRVSSSGVEFALLMELFRRIPPGQLLGTITNAFSNGIFKVVRYRIDREYLNVTKPLKLFLYHADLEFEHNASLQIAVITSNPEQSKHLETARMKLLDLEVDLVNLRSETYTDSRIPQMTIGTPKQDAERRDLTINSLFYNINTREVVHSHHRFVVKNWHNLKL